MRTGLTAGLTPAIPGIRKVAVIAAEYVMTLPSGKQRELREQESRGELRIVPRSEMSTVR